MNWIKRHPILTIFLAIFTYYVVTLAYAALLNYQGYCHAKNRWLTDREKILAVIKYYDDEMSMSDDSEGISRIPYESAEAYLTQYPDCCQVVKETDPIQRINGVLDFLDRVLVGAHYMYKVNIVYNARYRDKNNNIHYKEKRSMKYLTNCGYVID